MSQVIYKRYVPIVLTAVVSVYLMFNFFTNIGGWLADGFKSWGTTIQWMTYFFSTSYLVVSMINGIRRREKLWQINVYGMAVFLLYFVVGLSSWTGKGFAVETGAFQWLTQYVSIGTSSAYTLVIGVAYVIGAYRSFKIRNIDSLSVTFGFIVALFSSAPIFPSIWRPLGDLSVWVQAYVGKGASQGLVVAGAFGAVALGVRSMFGLEASVTGREVS